MRNLLIKIEKKLIRLKMNLGSVLKRMIYINFLFVAAHVATKLEERGGHRVSLVGTNYAQTDNIAVSCPNKS